MVVEVAQVVRGHRAEAEHDRRRQAGPLGDLLGVRGQQVGQPVLAVHQHPALPGQVVEPDVVELDPVGRHAEQRGEQPLVTDRHVAQADGAVAGVQQGAGDDADGVREVDDPG